jgi:alanine racemase
MPTQWIEVDPHRLADNIRAFRKHLGQGVKLGPVVKSNGYGHGLALAARAFHEGGADWLCVHSLAEAQQLRALSLPQPILILGPLAPEEVAPAVAAGHHVTVYDPRRLQELDQAALAQGRTAAIHLKIETGTHRQGVDPDGLGACRDVLRGAQGLRLEGVSTHFANIEDTTDHSYATRQLARFQEALAELEASGLRPPLRHAAASAAAILFANTHFDLARVGIAAYGYWPSRETLVSAQQRGADRLQIAPALTWKAAVAQIKRVPAGSFIGYGCSDKVEVDSVIAVLPVGYADGYRRAFAGKARVLIDGRRCHVRGRICMNLIMADVTHVPGARVGSEAVLLGRQGGEILTAETLAGWADTIHYEILAGLNPETPRAAVAGASA